MIYTTSTNDTNNTYNSEPPNMPHCSETKHKTEYSNNNTYSCIFWDIYIFIFFSQCLLEYYLYLSLFVCDPNMHHALQLSDHDRNYRKVLVKVYPTLAYGHTPKHQHQHILVSLLNTYNNLKHLEENT